MKSTIGRPRFLTDRQVKEILVWHEQYRAWRALRAALMTQRELARELGVSQSTISRVIRVLGQYKKACPELRRRLQG